MRDADCIAFLRWALPRLDLRWQGFREVHGQVCKRLKRRMKALGLADIAAYRARRRPRFAGPREYGLTEVKACQPSRNQTSSSIIDEA